MTVREQAALKWTFSALRQPFEITLFQIAVMGCSGGKLVCMCLLPTPLSIPFNAPVKFSNKIRVIQTSGSLKPSIY